MALAGFCALLIIDSDTKIGEMENDKEFLILMVRFICALALHLKVEGEILLGLQ